MKSKKLGFLFLAIAIIMVLSVPVLAIGGSKGYLVPVTIGKADRTRMDGYIVFAEKEIHRMAYWGSAGLREGSGTSATRKNQRVVWAPQEGRKSPPNLLMFESIRFMEGGHELFITYGKGKKALDANNFFSGKKIRFTKDSSHADILPQLLAPGEVLWIKRTGEPMSIK